MTRKLMKDTVSKVRKKERAELIREATERVLERLKPVVEEEIELVMESMERMKKQAMEPPMKRANEGAKKKRAMESTFSTQDAPAERNVNQRTSLDHQIKKSENVEFQLQFINNKLPDKIYTNDPIKDDSDGSVEIKLIDANSRKTIEQGPLSSMDIQIHVLDSDFGSDCHEEFNAKILNKRQLVNGTEKLLVKGKQQIKLTDGVGTIQDLQFIENSSWRPSKKFRLGARVLQSNSNMGQVRIKEAVSEAFAVRDYRSKMNKKHSLPSFDDEVWHLKKITRKGKFHTRLNDNNIHTIRDFKNMYKTNPIELREILKDCSDSDWKEIVNHASSVADDEKLNASSNPVTSPTTFPHQGIQGNFRIVICVHLFYLLLKTIILNYCNHASSSHHKSAFLLEPNLAPQSPAKSTCSPVNAQGKHDFPFEKLESSDSGQNSSQPSELNLFPTNNTQPMTESSQFNNGPHPHISGVQHPNALEAHSNHPEAEAYHNPTTGLAGMQYNKNHASSSHGHKGGFSTVPNLAAQPLATSTGYPVNAQGVQSISNFHPPTNGVSGRNLSQLNEYGFQCSRNDNPVMTQSSRFNNGPHSHIPAAHASNAFPNPVLIQGNAGACNSPTTGPLHHKYTGPHQVSSQNNNGLYPQFPGVKDTATGLPCHQYTEPNQGMPNNCNLAPSSQYRSATLQENDLNLTTQCPDDFLKADFNDSQQWDVSRLKGNVKDARGGDYGEKNIVVVRVVILCITVAAGT
ncbi:hypothetical protein EZV62_006508 [Acer yangbiense]|uniref:Calmodulin-binding domain-containing protein n=1 Tax=Acer yangbiense TaxID=1000413 RepID=A0A5C7I6R4_9ROSI|nr:hypothetical protein EZV62_006508 [Acer yangbiense]